MIAKVERIVHCCATRWQGRRWAIGSGLQCVSSVWSPRLRVAKTVTLGSVPTYRFIKLEINGPYRARPHLPPISARTSQFSRRLRGPTSKAASTRSIRECDPASTRSLLTHTGFRLDNLLEYLEGLCARQRLTVDQEGRRAPDSQRLYHFRFGADDGGMPA